MSNTIVVPRDMIWINDKPAICNLAASDVEYKQDCVDISDVRYNAGLCSRYELDKIHLDVDPKLISKHKYVKVRCTDHIFRKFEDREANIHKSVSDCNNYGMFQEVEHAKRPFEFTTLCEDRAAIIYKYMNMSASFALDYACNTGYFTRFFSRLGIKAHGVDRSAGSIQLASEITKHAHLNTTYEKSDNLRACLDKKTYDIVLLLGILHDISYSKELLDSLVRCVEMQIIIQIEGTQYEWINNILRTNMFDENVKIKHIGNHNSPLIVINKKSNEEIKGS